MMNFNQGQTFTLTTDDQQQLTYRIQTITEDGRLLVHSSLLERSYFISQQAFGDFLRVIGVNLEEKPAKYVLKSSITPIVSEHDTFNQALEVGSKVGDWPFQIELGKMICATWGPLSGLKFTNEYKSWYQDQQSMLAKVEGSYP